MLDITVSKENLWFYTKEMLINFLYNEVDKLYPSQKYYLINLRYEEIVDSGSIRLCADIILPTQQEWRF